jgi:hypothetical protein
VFFIITLCLFVSLRIQIFTQYFNFSSKINSSIKVPEKLLQLQLPSRNLWRSTDPEEIYGNEEGSDRIQLHWDWIKNLSESEYIRTAKVNY